MKLAAAAPVGQDSALSLEVSRVMATCIAARMSDLCPFEIGCHEGMYSTQKGTLGATPDTRDSDSSVDGEPAETRPQGRGPSP